jgi:hypothetical protein
LKLADGSSRFQSDGLMVWGTHMAEVHPRFDDLHFGAPEASSELTLIHIIGLDYVRHRLGRDNPHARRAVAAADRAIARVVETVERLGLVERTTFIVTGDHGGVDVHTALLPNVWLREAGLVSSSAADSWRVHFYASGGSAFLRLQASTDSVDGAHTLASVRAMLDRLPQGVRSLFQLIERAELNALGADPEASIALGATAGVVFSADQNGPAIQAAHGAGHGYLPGLSEMMTGFLASGAGVHPGAVVPLLPPLPGHILRLRSHRLGSILIRQIPRAFCLRPLSPCELLKALRFESCIE